MHWPGNVRNNYLKGHLRWLGHGTRTPCPSSIEVDPTQVPEETHTPENELKKTLNKDECDRLDMVRCNKLTEDRKKRHTSTAESAKH